MTDVRKLEGDIGPEFRSAIRTLRTRFTNVEPYAFDPNENVVLVSVENGDGAVYTRRLTINEHGDVFDQDRRKTNGHYGPIMAVDRYIKADEARTEVAPPKSALRRATVKRMRAKPVTERLLGDDESLFGRKSRLKNQLMNAERAFERHSDRNTLLVVQAARLALNEIDERIVEDVEQG